jgi:hypothetical protein
MTGRKLLHYEIAEEVEGGKSVVTLAVRDPS